MKTTLSTLISFLLIVPCFSQTKSDDVFYLWNSRWESVGKADSATYFSRLKKLDTCWQIDTYNFYGPMITSEQLKDKNSQVLHGRYANYRANGSLDSIGRFYEGKQHGDWYFYNDSGTVWVLKKYAMGELVSTSEPTTIDPDEKADSSESESSFPGGMAAWSRYLTRN